jgi:hypothetical protein
VNSSIKKKVNFEMIKSDKNKEIFKIENEFVAVDLKEIILNEL